MRLLISLFSPATGTWGGLTRVIAVAEAAKRSNHQVAFCASGELELKLRQRGYQVYATPSTTFFSLPRPLSRLIEKRSQNAALPVRPGRDFGNIWFVLMISGFVGTGYLRRLTEVERQVARDFQADMIFTDLDPGAFLTAQIEKLPVAAAYQSPMVKGINSLPWKLLTRSVGQVLRDHHLPAQTANDLFHDPRVLKIIPSIPELESTDAAPPDVCYTGQLLGDIQQDNSFHPAPGKRYVFVYVGTGSVTLNTLRAVLPQVFPADGNTICLVGVQSIQQVERVGGVEFHPYIPAASVLPHCDWTICHGGQNTIIQSLIAGVPLLIFPGPIFERRFNARMLQSAGAGQMGELPDFNAQWFRAALEKQAEYAASARNLGARICSFGGAETAVKAMEGWQNRIATQ